jgi:hypothetical protein
MVVFLRVIWLNNLEHIMSLADLCDRANIKGGPFDKEIITREWIQLYEAQGWHDGIWHGTAGCHYGFSLHKDKVAMHRFIMQDIKNSRCREVFEGTYDEAESRFPFLLAFDDIHPAKKLSKIIFVNDVIYEFVSKNCPGIFIDNENKYRNLYSFIRSQYGRIYQERNSL